MRVARCGEQPESSGAASVAADLRERDHRDRTRNASPLQAAENAVVINSTKMGEEEVLALAEKLVAERLRVG